MRKALVFDLYGTLIDIKTDEGDPGVYLALSKYLAYHAVMLKPDELKKIYSEEIQAHLKRSAEPYPDVDVYAIFSDIMHRYGKRRYPKPLIADCAMLFRSLTIRQFSAFPGVYEFLVSLGNRYKLAIVSDAQWVFTEPEIAMLGLGAFFRTRVLSSRYGYKKPDVRLFETALQSLRVKPEEAIYIGDNPQRDLVGAKGAGMACILFRSECRAIDGIQPDGCFSSYSELEGILSNLK